MWSLSFIENVKVLWTLQAGSSVYLCILLLNCWNLTRYQWWICSLLRKRWCDLGQNKWRKLRDIAGHMKTMAKSGLQPAQLFCKLYEMWRILRKIFWDIVKKENYYSSMGPNFKSNDEEEDFTWRRPSLEP